MTCTDAELVDKVCKGDMDAFSVLIGKYSNAVYGVAYGKLGDFHTAQDIAQEVFVKTYRKLPNLKEPEKLASWLYAVTARECMDWFRSNKKKTAYEFMQKWRFRSQNLPKISCSEKNSSKMCGKP